VLRLLARTTVVTA